jgi:hypothetical protein
VFASRLASRLWCGVACVLIAVICFSDCSLLPPLPICHGWIVAACMCGDDVCLPSVSYSIVSGEEANLEGPLLSYTDYQKWVSAGFSDSEITVWFKAMSGPLEAKTADAQEAARWRKAGFSPEAVYSWRELSGASAVTAEEAKELSAAGFSPSDVKLHADSLLWARGGFTANEAGQCQIYHVPYSDVVLWKAQGFACEQAAAWIRAGINPKDAAKWNNEGIAPEQVRNALALEAVGYSKERGISYAKRGITPERVEYSKAFDRAVQRDCHGEVHSQFELLMTSPYQTRGRCYEIIVGRVTQWLGPRTGMVGGRVLLDFKSTPATSYVQSLLVKGEGAISYTDVTGAPQAAPRVRELMQLR